MALCPQCSNAGPDKKVSNNAEATVVVGRMSASDGEPDWKIDGGRQGGTTGRRFMGGGWTAGPARQGARAWWKRLPGVCGGRRCRCMSRTAASDARRNETSPERIEKAVRAMDFASLAKGRRQKTEGWFFIAATTRCLTMTGRGLKATQAPLHAPPEPNCYQTAKARLVLGSGALLATAMGPAVDPAQPRFHTGCSFWPH